MRICNLPLLASILLMVGCGRDVNSPADAHRVIPGGHARTSGGQGASKALDGLIRQYAEARREDEAPGELQALTAESFLQEIDGDRALLKAVRAVDPAPLTLAERMTFGHAVDFLVERVRFERYAAELEVGMITVRPTYVLGYLIGMQEIMTIREEWVETFGEPMPPSQFYDALLTVGAIPPVLVRESLFGAH